MIDPLKHPYIPLTDPPAQLDAVFSFCTAWNGPLILDYQGQKMVLIPFDYYLEHENGGRPFILAGFSQGAKAVVELLKDMPSGVYERLVAAYVIGYNVSEREAEYFKTIEAARDSVDTGVTVCYNSVDSVDAICPVLSDSYLCINPVNWKTDGSPAYLNDSVTVRIDTKHHVLLVDGFDEKQYYLSSLGAMFKEGNYHLQELTFYQDCLNRNVKQRVRSYYRQPHKRGF